MPAMVPTPDVSEVWGMARGPGEGAKEQYEVCVMWCGEWTCLFPITGTQQVRRSKSEASND